MWSLFPRTLAAAALTLAAQSGQSHPSIASLKANPAAIAGRTVELEGVVVDVRSTSLSGQSGVYRLVDSSDAAGVLVRTGDLPADGGSFRVNARLPPAQPGGDVLVLDEIQRTQTDARPPAPLVALALSTMSMLVLAVLAGLAVRDQRRYLRALPRWLLPYAHEGLYEKTGTAPSAALPTLRYEPEFEAADQRRHIELRHRRRALLTGLGASAALAGLSAVWVATTRTTYPMAPAFILLSADDSTQAHAPAPGSSSPGSTSVGEKTPIVGIHPPEGPRPTAAVVKPAGRDTAGFRRPSPVTAPPPAGVAESVLKQPPKVVAEPSVTAAPPVPTPLVSNPTPPPAPPPPPPLPPPVSRPPIRSPEADRAEASSALQDAAVRLVAAINAKQNGSLAQLLPEEQAGDRSRLSRFLKLIKDFGPRAVLGTVGEPTLAGDRAEARFSLSLSWRGDFGVSSRKTGAFLGVLRHTDGGWRFDGARLLDNLP